MERVNTIEKLLKQTDEQRMSWQLILALMQETLSNGFNRSIVIDLQNHRINSVRLTDYIAGLTQLNYQIQKLD